MTAPGGPDSPVGPETWTRLRAHASGIASAAGVPARERDDVVEELHGHLVERTLAEIASGRSETAAADAAIASFGGIGDLATDLAGAFHSRLWMSTIGVLLPAVAVRDDRPAVIGWMRLILGINAGLAVFGIGLSVWQASPGHMAIIAAGLGLGLAGLVLAFQAVARGQRWAVWFALVVAAELVVFGVLAMVEAAGTGSANIPVGGILGLGVLLGALASWQQIERFVERSAPIGRGLTALLAVSLLGLAFTGSTTAAVPDPTQMTADDVRMTVAVACQRGVVTEPGYASDGPVQQVAITGTLDFGRGEILPNGLDGLFNPAFHGHLAGFRLSGGSPYPNDAWTFVWTDDTVVDVASGETVGWVGYTTRTPVILPETSGPFVAGIDPTAVGAGRTLRAEWLLVAAMDGETPWPSVEFGYAHFDRFLVAATAGCGETATGRQVLPTPVARDRIEPPITMFDPLLP